MRRWPIRWRLTAWYAAAMAVLLAVLGGAIYLGLGHQLNDTLDEELAARVALLKAGIQTDGGVLTVNVAGAADVSPDDQLVRVWSADGTLVLDSAPRVEADLEPERVRRLAAAEPYARVGTATVGGVTYRRALLPLKDGTTPAGVLELGVSREDIDGTLRALRLLFLVVAPLALAAAVGGGYLVAGRALKPVGTITDLARSITGDDLTRRLTLDLPDDELGRLAGTFDAMLDRVEDAFERQRRFTGDAAHELRTPLSLIRARVDLALARERPAADYRETLVELDRDVARLGDLVGTLLALARADAGTLALDREPLDLADLVRATVDQYSDAADGAGVRIVAETAPAAVSADGDQLVQLLVNLIDNALAHTPRGSTVTVGCGGDGPDATIRVEDTGAGIAAEHLDRLFDRFYRVDAGRSAAAGGVGLGLSICKAIVDVHGGTIAVASELGRGTRVDVRLPASV